MWYFFHTPILPSLLLPPPPRPLPPSMSLPLPPSPLHSAPPPPTPPLFFMKTLKNKHFFMKRKDMENYFWSTFYSTNMEKDRKHFTSSKANTKLIFRLFSDANWFFLPMPYAIPDYHDRSSNGQTRNGLWQHVTLIILLIHVDVVKRKRWPFYES